MCRKTARPNLIIFLTGRHFWKIIAGQKTGPIMDPHCYIMLREGTDAKAFEKKINRFLDKYNKEQTPHSLLYDWAFNATVIFTSIRILIKTEKLSGGRIQYVQLFSIVAIFILLIACINFMNLTTARSVKRAKEIGVRKVVGAVRFALIRQFIGEALLIVFLCCVYLADLVALILPQFNQLTRKTNSSFHLVIVSFWLSIAGLLLVTGFISGSYPGSCTCHRSDRFGF